VITIVFSPLGPFVPAPPEIAMHMLREQGPPPPFEPNGPPHGNTGMLGPMMGGPAPIIAMPPNFRHDPRRLRRFTPNSRISFFLMFVCSDVHIAILLLSRLTISFVTNLKNGTVLFSEIFSNGM